MIVLRSVIRCFYEYHAQGPVPRALVHGGSASVLDRHATVREPVGRVGEDHVHARRRHDLHELHAISKIDDRPRLTERLEVPEYHALFQVTTTTDFSGGVKDKTAPAQDPFGCSSSIRLTHSTAGGSTSPIPAHARSVTALS
jgi:hypothetical protein